MGPIHVKTEVFEGPFDLLLSLIEKRKLFINDISLAKVADDFIAYVKNLDQFPLADSAQFILIASTLVLIKSKSLLPTLELSEEEQGSIADLETRLKMYQKIKDVSLGVKERFGATPLFMPKDRKREPVFSPQKNWSVPSLLSAIKEVLSNLPKKEFLPKVIVDKVISLEEMISSLTERITQNLRMNFREFAHKGGQGREHRVHVIVSFLAMLELVKQGVIDVIQDKHFDDITIETTEIGTPRYG